MADWSAVYLREETFASESVAALGYAVFAAAMTGMRLLGDVLLARFGTLRLLRGFNALGAVAFAGALVFAPLGVAMIAFALMGLGLATVVPSAFAAAARGAESAARDNIGAQGTHAARAIALLSGFGYTGLLVGPPLFGWLAQARDLRWALALLVAARGRHRDAGAAPGRPVSCAQRGSAPARIRPGRARAVPAASIRHHARAAAGTLAAPPRLASPRPAPSRRG